MPCVQISTNVCLDGVDTDSIFSDATKAVAQIIGRPEKDRHSLQGQVWGTAGGAVRPSPSCTPFRVGRSRRLRRAGDVGAGPFEDKIHHLALHPPPQMEVEQSTTTTTDPPTAVTPPQSLPLIRNLASCNTATRSKALRELTTWLPTQPQISDDEMKKLWKGLFYCIWHADKAPFVMVILKGSVAISFERNKDPAAFAEIISMGGITSEVKKKLIFELGTILLEKLSGSTN